MVNKQTPLIIGAIHLPYYGRNNPEVKMDYLKEYVLKNVEVFYKNGIKCVYIQDENLEMEAAQPETIAILSVLGYMVKQNFPDIMLGIIIQAHDGIAPIAIANACGADFVRMKVFAGTMLKAEGIRVGVGIYAEQYCVMTNSNVKIYADIHDREGIPLEGAAITDTAGWAVRYGADGLIITGKTFDETLSYLKLLRKQGINKPLIVGGGVNEKNIKTILELADGAVVSTSLMLDEPMEGSLIRWDGNKIRKFTKSVAQCIS
jgi:hypothetical protein